MALGTCSAGNKLGTQWERLPKISTLGQMLVRVCLHSKGPCGVVAFVGVWPCMIQDPG